jgi:hypothetical protein
MQTMPRSQPAGVCGNTVNDQIHFLPCAVYCLHSSPNQSANIVSSARINTTSLDPLRGLDQKNSKYRGTRFI